MIEIDDEAFSRLMHAYGRAGDTPGHLRALLGDDAEARQAALGHLGSAVLHQGTPWTATVPTALVVGRILREPAMLGPDRAGPRRALLSWLGQVGAAAAEPYPGDLVADANPPGRDVRAEIAEIVVRRREPWDWVVADARRARAMWAQITLDGRRAAPELAAVVGDFLSDPDPGVRTAAAYASTQLALAAGDAELSIRLTATLTALADGAEVPERAALVLAIGELGAVPRRFLDDPHPGVRVCAALAPGLADDPRASGELVGALSDPATVDSWFPAGLPGIVGHLRFTVLDAVLERISDFAVLVPAALAIVAMGTAHEAGALLRKAFPDPPIELTGPQRALLRAVADRESLWHGPGTVLRDAFQAIRLPYDRAASQALADAADPRAWLG